MFYGNILLKTFVPISTECDNSEISALNNIICNVVLYITPPFNFCTVW
jgi:hypothetical protein